MWLKERRNGRSIARIVESDAYQEAVQWRDWDLCDYLLEPALDEQLSIQAERQFVAGLRGAGL